MYIADASEGWEGDSRRQTMLPTTFGVDEGESDQRIAREKREDVGVVRMVV